MAFHLRAVSEYAPALAAHQEVEDTVGEKSHVVVHRDGSFPYAHLSAVVVERAQAVIG